MDSSSQTARAQTSSTSARPHSSVVTPARSEGNTRTPVVNRGGTADGGCTPFRPKSALRQPSQTRSREGASLTEHKGFLPTGNDLTAEFITIADAKKRCLQIKGCKGFTFRGKIDDEPRKIWFKDRWTGFKESQTWTSYKYEAGSPQGSKHGARPGSANVTFWNDGKPQEVAVEILRVVADDNEPQPRKVGLAKQAPPLSFNSPEGQGDEGLEDSDDEDINGVIFVKLADGQTLPFEYQPLSTPYDLKISIEEKMDICAEKQILKLYDSELVDQRTMQGNRLESGMTLEMVNVDDQAAPSVAGSMDVQRHSSRSRIEKELDLRDQRTNSFAIMDSPVAVGALLDGGSKAVGALLRMASWKGPEDESGADRPDTTEKNCRPETKAAQRKREEDPKYTGVGRPIRKTAFQVLTAPGASMSPHRRYFVYNRAREILGVEEEDEDINTEPFRVRVLRRFGLLNLAIAVEVKRIRCAEEEPFCPEINAIVSSLVFEGFVGILISINLGCIGMDTYYDTGERPAMLAAADHCMVMIFIIECIIRVSAHTWVWFFDWNNFFDVCIIVGTGVLPLWILGPAGVSAQFMRQFSIVRTLRLVRLCRVLRCMPGFGDLWMLVQGMVTSLSLLFWIFVVYSVVIFIFAVAFVEIFGKSDEFADDEHVQQMFGGMSSAMWTLFETVTLANWADKARPMCMKNGLSAILWMAFIGVGAICLFNLTTAIVIKNALDEKDADAQANNIAKQYAYIRKHTELMRIFNSMDEDKSGELSREEFFDILEDVQFVRQMKVLDVDLQELPDIFEILDDGDGSVTADEFVTGMMRLQGAASSADMLKATKMMARASRQTIKLHKRLDKKANIYLENTEEALGRTHRGMMEAQHLLALVIMMMDKIGARFANKGAVAAGLPRIPPPDPDKELGKAITTTSTGKQTKKQLQQQQQQQQKQQLGKKTLTEDTFTTAQKLAYLPPDYAMERLEKKKKEEDQTLREKLIKQLEGEADAASEQSSRPATSILADVESPDARLIRERLNCLAINVANFSIESLRENGVLDVKQFQADMQKPSFSVSQFPNVLKGRQSDSASDSHDQQAGRVLQRNAAAPRAAESAAGFTLRNVAAPSAAESASPTFSRSNSRQQDALLNCLEGIDRPSRHMGRNREILQSSLHPNAVPM